MEILLVYSLRAHEVIYSSAHALPLQCAEAALNYIGFEDILTVCVTAI